MLAKQEGMSNRAFETFCGIGNGSIKNIGEGVSTQTIAKIYKCFPNISLHWLILGEGDMYESEKSSEMAPISNDSRVDALLDTISLQSRRIEDYKAQIAALEAKLAKAKAV